MNNNRNYLPKNLISYRAKRFFTAGLYEAQVLPNKKEENPKISIYMPFCHTKRMRNNNEHNEQSEASLGFVKRQ